MTKYYFNIRAGERYIADQEGQEHTDLDEAKEEAMTAAREILSEAVRFGEVIDGRRFEITDSEGNLCATVPFSEALRFQK